MRRLIIIIHLLIFILCFCFASEISEKKYLLDRAEKIESIILDKNYEQLSEYIDEDMGLFITDSIKMNSFYSVHLSKKMISNIKFDNHKYAFFVDDDPREPAWSTLSHFMNQLFNISDKKVENIECNHFYKSIDFDLENSLINAWKESVFIEYYYSASEKYIIDWLTIYFIFKEIKGEYKLVGISRNYQ